MSETSEDFALVEGMEPDELRSALEALLLVVDAPATAEQLGTALEEPEERITADLRAWAGELAERRSGMELRESAEGWRLYSRAEYAPYVERLLLDGVRSKLTRAALETLAVIAYKQPVSRSQVSAVRGVNVDGVMRTLAARDSSPKPAVTGARRRTPPPTCSSSASASARSTSCRRSRRCCPRST